jgi:hypothetical protein
MPRNYPAPVIHEFTNLPPLTTEQANVVAAILTAGPSLIDMAEATHYDLAHFLDLYASPEVRAHIAAAKSATTDNVTIRLTEAAHTATEVLETLAQNTENDKTERRRAATTILRSILPRSWRGRCHRVREVTEGASAQHAFEDLVRSLVQPSGGDARETDGRGPAPSPRPLTRGWGEASERARDLIHEMESILRSHDPDTGGVKRVREYDGGSPAPSPRPLTRGRGEGSERARDVIQELDSIRRSHDSVSRSPVTDERAPPAHAAGPVPSRVREHASPSDPSRVRTHATPQDSGLKTQDSPPTHNAHRPTERAPP